MSGWVRLAIVFVAAMWAYGCWDLMRDGAPALIWSGDMAEWGRQWSDWFVRHQVELAVMAARPLLILAGVAAALWTLKWVIMGFFKEKQG